MLWFRISCRTIVYGTSDGPQNILGNYLGPCSNYRTTVGEIWQELVELEVSMLKSLDHVNLLRLHEAFRDASSLP